MSEKRNSRDNRIRKFFRNLKKSLRLTNLSITKREKFVISVLILSFGLFFSESLLGRSGLFVLFFLSLLTDVFLLWSLGEDMKKKLFPILLLPFLFSLSFGLFYFLVPARFITRLIITTIYAIGLYSLFLSQNIFVISSFRTIALLSSARIVSFILAVVSYFFLANIAFSFHLEILPLAFVVLFFSFLLIFHSLWIYANDMSINNLSLWSLALSLCLFEISFILWFWPSDPTVMALFFTGYFYTIVGLSHVWFDKRLFRNVLWEYIWVAVIVLFVLISFTTWGAA